MGRLSGKIAWVTGAGSGIGEAVAERFGAEGVVTVISGRRKERLEEVAGRIAAKGGTAHVQPADLTKAEEVGTATDWIAKTFGRLDILVNNAGVNVQDRSWARLGPKEIDTLIQGNLTSAFYVAQAVLPIMRAQGGGVMVHTASMAGRNVSPMSGPGYGAAKHGVVAMSHSINMEECVNGIRSTVFCPGEVNTEILKQRPNPLTPEQLAQMLQPEDCADLIAYAAALPPHVTMNEIWLTPTHNRGYVAALGRKL
ncbi:SDR family oxidoreductase [Siccirubricoccus sp. KC 17139]|uniref:SDR family oxidoreductase n=1 Tax=Siccirubricoccus soli TaxID=2899147 RepID=A0ABT1D5H3_9PROT|nr:SDR family oxidoreductase [Siccirubricoccus soli]MCO6417109.1 SDR family oxidoreductase [Siccirubricoccus soli]MCP2683244.1 SDR family oxidoreductase [Siccirubricoccus soli]